MSGAEYPRLNDMPALARETAVAMLAERIVTVLDDAGGYASFDHVCAQLSGVHRDDIRVALNRLIGGYRWPGRLERRVTTSGQFLFA